MEQPILEFRHVTKSYKDFTLKDISFQLEQGYIFGLLGPNGAGKTTLLHQLMDSSSNYKGQILLNGVDIKTNPIQTKNQIGFISEQNSFFMEESPDTNGTYYAPFYSNFDTACFHNYLRKLDVPIYAQSLSTFSKGTFIKFQLAFAIAHHPVLYVMDEPTAGLDPVYRREFLHTLQEIIGTEKASIVLSTQITSDLDQIGDYIAFMKDGRLVFIKDHETLRDEMNDANSEVKKLADLFE